MLCWYWFGGDQWGETRAPSFRKNSSPKDFAAALSSEEGKFWDLFSRSRGGGGGGSAGDAFKIENSDEEKEKMSSKLKFWQNLLKAKAFCTAANVSNWFQPLKEDIVMIYLEEGIIIIHLKEVIMMICSKEDIIILILCSCLLMLKIVSLTSRRPHLWFLWPFHNFNSNMMCLLKLWPVYNLIKRCVN